MNFLDRFKRAQDPFLAAILLACLTGSVEAVPWESRHGMSPMEFQDEFNTWTAEPYNYRMLSVCGYEEGGQERFAAVWAGESGPAWNSHASISQAQFEALRDNYAGDGFHPVFISGYGVGGQARYNAIFEYEPGADVASDVGMSYAEFVAELAAREAAGYEPAHVWTFDAGGVENFTAVWRAGGGVDYAIRVRQSASEYQQQFNALGNQGYQLIAVSTAVIGNNTRYTGVWRMPGNGIAGYAYHDLSAANYQGEASNAYYQNYRTVFASAFTDASGLRFNAIFQDNGAMTPDNLGLINDALNGYIQSNSVPGLSVAISRDGELLYAQGFGEADQDAGEWVHPDHRFRIASVSKPVTAAAAMRLRDVCGLDLEATVFGPNGILGETFGTPPYSAQEEAITVRQLLYHISGWAVDGIWQVGGSDPDAAIDWQLDNTEPANPPGTVWDYMNIGFTTVARAIERITGKSYEEFVQDEVLMPSCVTSMEIGSESLAEKLPNEVVYYQSGDFGPYDLSPHRMDAHGGWIARPIDLLQFMRRIDGDPGQADILSADSYAEMHTGTPVQSNRGLGIYLEDGWVGHAGAMPGSISWLVYRDDGYAFAVTCNTRPPNDWDTTTLRGVLTDLVDTLDAAGAFPTVDLFPCDIPAGEAPPGQAEPEDIYVDWSNGCFNPNGALNPLEILNFCWGGPFPTVGQAIDSACAGDSLYIHGGSYSESVVFDRFMTIHAYDGSAVIGQ